MLLVTWLDAPGALEARGCVAASSRGLVDGCAGTPCRPPPIRAGKARRTPHSACAMTSACSTAEGRPIYGIGAGSHRPAQGANGRPGPRDGMRHAIWLCSPPFSLTSFFCSTRGADILPSRPRRTSGAARRPRQGWPAGPSVDDGLGLVWGLGSQALGSQHSLFPSCTNLSIHIGLHVFVSGES